jgi:hypothetical protein
VIQQVWEGLIGVTTALAAAWSRWNFAHAFLHFTHGEKIQSAFECEAILAECVETSISYPEIAGWVEGRCSGSLSLVWVCLERFCTVIIKC